MHSLSSYLRVTSAMMPIPLSVTSGQEDDQGEGVQGANARPQAVLGAGEVEQVWACGAGLFGAVFEEVEPLRDDDC